MPTGQEHEWVAVVGVDNPMAWRRLSAAELLAGPAPLWWWIDHGKFGVRGTARKQLALSVSLADLLWQPYADSLDEALRIEEATADGRMVVQNVSLLLAVADVQSSVVPTGRSTIQTQACGPGGSKTGLASMIS